MSDEKKPEAPPAAAPATVKHASLDDAILAVMSECPYIQKKGKAGTGTFAYTFAGDREIIKELHPLLVKHRLTFVPVSMVVPSERANAQSTSATSCARRIAPRASSCTPGMMQAVTASSVMNLSRSLLNSPPYSALAAAASFS